MKILLVDDEASLTRMMKRNLEATGRFEVLDVNDPNIVLEVAHQFRPDLVILDIMMPGLDGKDVAAYFSVDLQLAHIPIIFLSAILSQTEIEPTGSRKGSYTFLAKPVKFDDLLTCINNLLGIVETVDHFA